MECFHRKNLFSIDRRYVVGRFRAKEKVRGCELSRTVYDNAPPLVTTARDGRNDAPGHINSPGAQHSTTAKVAAQQLLEPVTHFGPPPLVG
jgi:hypothetical protein